MRLRMLIEDYAAAMFIFADAQTRHPATLRCHAIFYALLICHTAVDYMPPPLLRYASFYADAYVSPPSFC